MFFSRKKEEPVKSAEHQLADIAGELVKQNRRASRRRFFIILIIVIYAIVMTTLGFYKTNLFDDMVQQEKAFVAEISLSGAIGNNGAINSDDTIEILEKAFAHKNAKAIILKLNSGGGSPVQSANIYKNIKRLKQSYNKKIFVVIEDICASGCYYIASGADEIYANKSSIVGGIGVIMPSFGFDKAIEKLGIERRIYSAGDNKSMLDVFSPEDHEDVTHIKEKVLNVAHNNFIDDVKTGRGDRLIDDDKIFNGLIWLGDDAKKLGLIDGLGDSYFVANDVIGINNKIKFEHPKSLIEELTEASINFLMNQQYIKLY